MIPVLDALGVELERHIGWGPTRLSLQFLERFRQGLQVPVIARVAEVEIAGDNGRASDGCGEPADQNSGFSFS